MGEQSSVPLRFAAFVFACLFSLFATRADAATQAAIVVDAITGEIIYQANADAGTSPASLAKMMTLYLTFEALHQGRLKLSQALPVSRRAANQPPSKLGLVPGQTLRVEDAIRGLVTKSANDAAMVLSEAIGGSEENFAQKMTAKAKALGMTNTNFRNSSGLFHSQQYTTARDMAKLGVALMRDHPEYYPYFSTPSFTYRGATFANHNGLLGKYPGVDGLKTGYIDASGYNLAASVNRDGLRLIGVVMGGKTASARDRQMASLFDMAFNRIATLQPLGQTQRTPQLAAVPAGGTLPAAPKNPPAAANTKASPPAAKAPTQTAAAAGNAKAAAGNAKAAGAGTAAAKTPAPAAPAKPAAPQIAGGTTTEGWAIQAGAYTEYDAASRRLQQITTIVAPSLRAPAGLLLPDATNGVHRVRIGGLSLAEARNACRILEARGMGCVTISPAAQANDIARVQGRTLDQPRAEAGAAPANEEVAATFNEILRMLRPKEAAAAR